MSERPHGYARYKLDYCRCYTCARAVSDYERTRQMRKTAGTWQPFVDAAPIRAHLVVLADRGVGYKRAADIAGVSRSAVGALLFGRRGKPPGPRVRRETAERLLTVQPDPAAGAVVDGTGTARRIQALSCLGWSLTAQATRIGWTVQNFAPLANGHPVVGRTAALVAEMFEQLSATPAPAGATTTRTRAMAIRKRWMPPLAWDDQALDDPTTLPCLIPPVAGSDPDVDELTVQHAVAGHRVDLTPAVRDELIRRLSANGMEAAAIAPIVGSTPRGVQTHRSRLGLTRGRDLAAAVTHPSAGDVDAGGSR